MSEARFAGIGMTSARTRERLIQRLIEQGIKNSKVLERIRSVPRHIFIDEALASRAYEDTALPIGFGQTISQPFMVAYMTEVLLEAGPLYNVLEIGTGCGYQSAVLSGLVSNIHTIERIESLFIAAKQRLKAMGIQNISFRHGDGYEGWRAKGPYNGIIVAAAPVEVPLALLSQLAMGGRLIMPVGADGAQQLILYTRNEQGLQDKILGPAAFVPLQAGVL